MSLVHKSNHHSMVHEDPDDSIDTGRSRPSDRRKMIQIPVPWSTKFLTIRNYDICFVILVGMAITGGYYLREIQDTQTTISTNQTKELAALDELTYVLSLSQDARDKLNIEMPDGLRKKIKRNYDE